jgi:hypothetical protein
MRMSTRAFIAVLLLALGGSVSAGAGPAAGQTATAEQAAPAQRARGSADAPRTTTVVSQPAVRQDRSAFVTVLLVGAGAVVGVVVGVIPALLVAMLLGYLAPPRVVTRTAGVLTEPPRAPPAMPEPPQPAAARELVALATPEDPLEEASRSGQLAILPHARHQGVYDAAYAEQLDRVQALRSAIGGRRGKPPEPPATEPQHRS